jgi:hypothetical protein
MEHSVIQYFGYAASAIIAISMMINSIVKFRWVNLIGAFIFSVYGFTFGAYPVGILNGFIVLVDLYYLSKIYSKKELFETLEINQGNKYLPRFLNFHKDEIQKFFPGFIFDPEEKYISFFILRNMAVAGVFLAKKQNNNILLVDLDYVIPQYRDFKNGKHIYLRVSRIFIDEGITTVAAQGKSKEYSQYLKKLGFSIGESGLYFKKLV